MNKLKHPGIVKLIRTEEKSSDTWLITEPVTPLQVALQSLSPHDIVAGCYDVVSTLVFIHEKVGN